VLSICPCNMRKYVDPPADKSDILLASAGLLWEQILNTTETPLWELVTETTQKVHHEITINGGLRFFHNMATKQPMAYSLMSSSIGVNQIQAKYGSKLKVLDVQFMGGTYINYSENVGMVTHVHTFDNKLHSALTYSKHNTYSEFIEKHHRIQEMIFKNLADPSFADTVPIGKYLNI